MKRIKEACICQTLVFLPNEANEEAKAKSQVREEVASYKRKMEEGNVVFKILEEKENPDGSVEIKLKKQYGLSPVGSYLE